MKVLTDVRHVLELKRNLISLGMLDEFDYKCKIENGIMKITKEPYVSMKGIRANGWYVLLSKTETISTVATVSSDPSDQTVLWHRKLFHMSEKDLYYLNRERVFGKDIINNVDFYENCILGK